MTNLFKSFCCSFYSSPLWNFNSESFSKLCTSWNIAIRTLLDLPARTHTSYLGPLLNQLHVRQQLYLRNVRFLYTMYKSDNIIARTCFHNALYNANSCIGAKLAFIRYMYGVDITRHDINFVNARISTCHINPAQQAAIDNLYTLISARSSNTLIPGFERQEIDVMIECIATD